jgi:adenylate cyclase
MEEAHLGSIMGVEIERRFILAEPPSFLVRLDSLEIEQWYPPNLAGLILPKEALEVVTEGVRIRCVDNSWIATIKGPWVGAARAEFEWDISPMQCHEEWPKISKTRYLWPSPDGLVWEIDVFKGELAGLVIAEVELTNEEDEVEIPSWALGELTGLNDWSNAALAHSSWAEVSQCLMDARQVLIPEEGMDGN